ncbi:MAG: Ig-like domain-containing protein [Bacteroidota bacterium]
MTDYWNKLFKFVTAIFYDGIMKMKYLQHAILFFLLLWITACARVVAPTGGPKDVEPPGIVSSQPPNFSTNFKSDLIKIQFDEFIQLKDLNQNLIVSPPVEEKPNIVVKGKSLHIEIPSELRDSTTYNIYMGNSLQDYTEGNPIENFQYVFSTGKYIDSMSVQGKVLNAFNLLPEEDVLVMLYSEHSDSVPMKDIPEYISKTDEEGFFQINNIRNEAFKLFVLRDVNKNYLYDVPDEEIAFTDSLVSFRRVTESFADTVFVHDSLLDDPDKMVVDSIWVSSKEPAEDSLDSGSPGNAKDSLIVVKHRPIDTIVTGVRSFYTIPEYFLMLFSEDKELQYLSDSKREDKRRLELIFNKPLKDSVFIELADTTTAAEWYIQEINPARDVIYYWLTDTALYNQNRLNLYVTYPKEESKDEYYRTTDTLSFRYFEKEKDKEAGSDEALSISMNVQNKSTFDLNKQVKIQFETPLQSVDRSKIEMYIKEDTLEKAVDVQLEKDSLLFRQYNITNVFEENADYRLAIYPRAFTDIYGAVNDTVMISFKTEKIDYYGKILANITGIDSTFQAIAQIIIPGKDKEEVLREKIVPLDQTVEFTFLPPKDFIFKVIADANFNGKWDTGEYLEHRQPEEVFYYENSIKVRSNWDIEIEMPLKK